MTIVTCAWCAAEGVRTVVAVKRIEGYTEIADGMCKSHEAAWMRGTEPRAFTVQLTARLDAQLDNLAMARDASRSGTVRSLIRECSDLAAVAADDPFDPGAERLGRSPTVLVTLGAHDNQRLSRAIGTKRGTLSRVVRGLIATAK